MVDFRYHAMSLVAVFLALGIGIVLGVTVGDSLVSGADRNLRESLREDVTEAREKAREEAELAQLREDVLEELVPEVARGRLRGRRIALVATGELPGAVEDAVEEAVEAGGGSIQSTTVLSVEDDLEELARDAPAGPSLRMRIAPEGGDAARLGGRIGRAIVLGESGMRRLVDALPQRFSGNYARPVEGVVLYRHPPPEAGEDEDDATAAELRETFDGGLLEGLGFGEPVIGVETTETDPSQVEWYDDHPIVVASVDNVDTAEGALALVFVLAARGGDAAEGNFGAKGSAERPLPDLSD